MPDYGHDLLFGTFLPPTAERADDIIHLAEVSDRVGLDLVSVQDHPYQAAFLETWTLLSVIAARTSRVRVFPSVANLPLRPPAMLARSAASLDILSGGRVELGLGAGAFWDAIEAMDGPRRAPGEAVAAVAEAIELIRSLWTPGRGVRFDGEHYRLAGARPGPFPVHPIGIWLGALRPRMLRLTGRAADGLVVSSPYIPPEQLAGLNQIVDEAADAAGRGPEAVRRVYNLVGSFERQVRRLRSGPAVRSGPGQGAGTGRSFLQGPPQVWAEQLAELAGSEGVSVFIHATEIDGESDLRRFAEEVAPAVRELVAKERTATSTGTATPKRPDALRVVPTTDPGERLSDERVWDESTRPRGPAPEAGVAYSDRGRANAQHLIDVHDHFRQELGQLRDLVRQVANGEVDVAAARSALHTTTMRQNRWTLGTYCETYCGAVTTHHRLEDVALFPQLRRADRRLEPVIDRLAEEHDAIAGVLDRVDAALVAMVGDPDSGIEDVRRAVDLLTDTLLSHLSYEERELVEPIARLPIGLG
jgi:alkanesulfonate monooxygenase SsuD/methylene tetrahydromethanopterin reductase-like flavin-dependent oxidoreductase (luciferase family)